MLYLFHYLLICFKRISLGWTLGKNSTSCLDGLWEYCPLFHVCRPYWKPFVAPDNKQIHFLLARHHSVSFPLFLIYSPFWIQLLPLATRILFPVSFGLQLWVLYGLHTSIHFSLFLLATSIGCICRIQCLVLIYQFVVLSDNLSLRTHLAYNFYIYSSRISMDIFYLFLLFFLLYLIN